MKLDGTRRADVDGLPLPAVTFDLLTQKPNNYDSRPMYTCDLILVKLAATATKILHLHGFHCIYMVFRVIACCDLDLWPFEFKIQPVHLWTQIHTWPKLCQIPFTGFWDMVFARFSRTDRPHYKMPPAPFFNGGGLKVHYANMTAILEDCYQINPLKCSSVRWSHLEVFSAIQV